MRQNLKTTLAAGLTAFLLAGGAHAQTEAAPACGGDFKVFLDGVRAEAMARGVSADVVDRALAGAAIDQKVLSRDQLMELTQGREADVFDRSIDLLVSRLRQRLGDNARESAIIKTVRNEGYVLAAEVTAEALAGALGS